MKKCPICNEAHDKRGQTCSKSCAVKLQWRKPGAKEQRISAIKSQAATKEGKENRSNAQKKNMQNPETIEKIRKGTTKTLNTKYYKEKRSKLAKERWADPEYKEKMANIFKERWQDPEVQQNHFRALEEAYKSFEYRKKISDKAKERWANPEFRQMMEDNWNDPKWRAPILAKFNDPEFKKSCRWKKSAGEKVFNMFLEENGIEFSREFYVNVDDPNNMSKYYAIDFAICIGDRKIGLECDGKQHLLPEAIEHDKRRDKYLSSKGWEIYRIPWKGGNVYFHPFDDSYKNELDLELEKFIQSL